MSERTIQRRIIAESAVVSPRASVGQYAQVLDRACIQNTASVDGEAIVSGRAHVTGASHVGDLARVSDDCYVGGSANISQYANISASARVYGGYIGGLARMRGYATLHAGHLRSTADVFQPDHILAVGPIGSEGRIATAFRAFSPYSDQWGCLIAAGCFTGTIAKLRERVNSQEHSEAWPHYETEDRAPFAEDYNAFLDMAEVRLARWRARDKPTDADREWWADQFAHTGPDNVGYYSARFTFEDLGEW